MYCDKTFLNKCHAIGIRHLENTYKKLPVHVLTVIVPHPRGASKLNFNL